MPSRPLRPIFPVGVALGCAGLAACHSVSPTLNRGPAALSAVGVADATRVTDTYRIGPSDELRVQVLYEPELSVAAVRVGPDGRIEVPMAGGMDAANKSTDELAGEITGRLRRYVRDPRVVVSINQYARQFVTVEGSVEAPGTYNVPGTSSLLQTLALAKGPRRTARLNEILVFRTVGGQRTGAVFDLGRIRHGYDPDPLILGGDVVIVGYSELKGAFRDILTAAPAIGVFRPY